MGFKMHLPMKSALRPLSHRLHAFPLAILVLAVLNVWRPVACAAPADSQRATSVVLGWLKTNPKPMNTALGGTVRRVETHQDATGADAYHVVYLEPSGFVVVAADDRIEPIICFAPAGVFDPSEKNPLGALVSRDMAGRMAWVRKGAPGAAGLMSTAKWQKFELGATSPMARPEGLTGVSDVRVAPLTVTTWDQATAMGYGLAACYNYYTPPYAAGTADNYVSGCVATAMAQFMYYYQYPTAGVGTASFSIQTNNVATIRSLRGGDGNGGPYVWTNMPANPPSTPPTNQCQAIGSLVADAGVSVGMNYSADGSSASLYDGKNSLLTTFHYGNAVYGQVQDNINSNFLAMVNADLDASAPVLLAISDSSGNGHAVVADGYGYSSSTLYHHLNLGWSGYNTAWYALPLVDTTDYRFTSVDGCLYNAFTNGSGEIISGRVLDQNALPVAGATVIATRTGGGAYTALTDSQGIYALVRVPSGSQYSLTATKAGYSTATLACATKTSADFSTCGNVWGVNFAISSSSTAVDHFAWSAIGAQGVNVPFGVAVSALNTTNGLATSFSGTVSFSAAGVTAVSNTVVGTLGTQQNSTYAFPLTFGYTFTPNTNIQVVAVRSYFGTKVSIWTGTGSLLASQSVSSQPGTWVETPLASTLTLSAGVTYCVGVYCPAGTPNYSTYYANEWPASFPNGTVGQSELYCGSGDGFPTSTFGTGLGPFLDLRYTVQQQASVGVSPTISGTFTNGFWTGNLIVQQIASNVVLTANDGQGHSGSSSCFNVGAYAPIVLLAPHDLTGSQFQFAVTGGYKYQILVSTDLLNWTTLVTMTNLVGATNYVTPAMNLPHAFYRAWQIP
jgi:hypothetical protein